MKPISENTIDGVTKYTYDTKELKEWLRRGRKYGDVGSLCISKHTTPYHFHKFIIFGTIENPCKILQYLTMMDSPYDNRTMFPNTPSFESFTFEILDLGKT